MSWRRYLEMDPPSGRLAVVGAGAWGTVLADVLGKKGFDVDLWVFEEELAGSFKETHMNDLYLPGHKVSGRINPTSDLGEVVRGKDLIVMVVPSHVYRSVASRMIEHISSRVLIISASKGIENETLLSPFGIWRDVFPDGDFRYVALSGPSFAKEVIAEVPSAVTVAGTTPEAARVAQVVFSTKFFRAYTSLDVVGVELGGALKNIIAIAAGISDGLGFGHNARAALITRGIGEISRMGVRMGANPLTFSGLSGMGDLVLTCTGDLSRNRTLGLMLGRGMSLEEILASTRTVAEGVKTTRSAYELAKRLEVDMPILEQVYHVLFEGRNPRDGLRMLMERDLKDEIESTYGKIRVHAEGLK